VEILNNKIFLDYFKSKSEIDISIFQTCFEKIENSRQKRFQLKTLGSEYPVYHNFEMCLLPYINSSKFKFVDLYQSIIASINIKSYGSALILSRAILEHFSMLVYLTDKLENYLDKKEYLNFAKILFTTGVDHQAKDILKEYKRIHVYDALRYFSRYIEKLSNKTKNSISIMHLYDSMSEMTHPAPTSLLMYETNTTKTNSYNDLVTNHSFSFNSVRIHDRIFPLITMVINLSGLLMGDVYPKIEKNLLEKFKNNKEIINLYFKNNPEEGLKILNLINFEYLESERNTSI
tara:strand:- start:162 stop:1031 length:870 start_codon:yes stop_codon:yes gene_type:complete